MMKNHPPGNYVKARNGLPEIQKTVFDDIVADFSHTTNLHDKTGYVPYYALSEMVRMGWRLAEEPDDARRQMRLLEVALQALGPAGPPDLHEFFYKDSPCGTVASSYKRTGDLLCRLLEDNPDKSLIFPMLFCYRHFIEVNLKRLLLLAGVDLQAVLNEDEKKKPHSLVILHQILSVRLPDNAKTATIGKKTSVQKELERIRKWAARMNKVDPKSDRFRYAEDKRSRPYDFPDLHSLFQLSELSVLHTEMERLNESFYHVAIVLVGPPETEGNEAN
ncbi:MAG: hypothetical protein GX117_07460 [Candidatus Hydrogenedentes bacterium]|nr:hypothetical protein [Candidatus Hydrogenedentota bacterium]